MQEKINGSSGEGEGGGGGGGGTGGRKSRREGMGRWKRRSKCAKGHMAVTKIKRPSREADQKLMNQGEITSYRSAG